MAARSIIAEEACKIAHSHMEPKVPIMADPAAGLWENGADRANVGDAQQDQAR